MKKVNWRQLDAPLAAAITCAFVAPAFGAGADDALRSTDMTLGEVVVSGARDRFSPSTLFTSVDLMEASRFQNKNVMNSWELLGQMPGVQLTEFRMGTESGKPSFRAFNGEGYINGIKVLIDGVPANANSGNPRYMDMVFPLDLERVEVVRGTNDPRYGLHNIAGNVNLITRQGGNDVDGRLTYGSFGFKELQSGFAHESGGFAQNYFFAAQQADGYRANSASDRYSFAGKWFFTPEGADTRLGLIVRAYQHDAREPGYLTAAELAADRWQAPAKNANDRGSREMHHVSAHLEHRFSPSVSWISKAYVNDMKDDRHITYTSNATSTSPRQRRFWDETHVGVLNSLSWEAGERVTVDAGFNYERQQNRYRRYRFAYAVPTDFSTPVTTSNDEDYGLDNIGAYLQATVVPADRWKVVPAIRVDRFDGESLYNSTGTRYPLRKYGLISQPKLSVAYTPTQNVNIYANWGKTFQVLTGGTIAYQTTAAIYQPSINTGYELGVKVRLSPRVEARVAAWQQDATQEIANLPSADSTQNLGETRRRGLDLQLNAELASNVSVWLSHAIQEARVVAGYAVSGTSLTGKEVFSTPRFISNAGVDVRATDKLRFGVQARAQGSYFIDDLNTRGKFGDYLLVDSGLSYAVSKKASIDLQVKNLFDRKYEYVWFDNFFWPAGSHQPMYSPGPGRAIYLSLSARL